MSIVFTFPDSLYVGISNYRKRDTWEGRQWVGCAHCKEIVLGHIRKRISRWAIIIAQVQIRISSYLRAGDFGSIGLTWDILFSRGIPRSFRQ